MEPLAAQVRALVILLPLTGATEAIWPPTTIWTDYPDRCVGIAPWRRAQDLLDCFAP